MGQVTGTTQNRLDVVKTYDPSNPYIVGVNGVTNLTYDSNGDLYSVKYVIGNINYETILSSSVKVINEYNNNTKSYIPQSTPNSGVSNVFPTTFSYTTQLLEETSYFVFKDERKMGVVFSPKVYDEIFIERQKITIFEQQARLSEIDTLDRLEGYNNGFYNIVNLE